MPSAPCGMGMVPIMRRAAVSTTATASLVLNEANSFPVAWLTAIQCGEPPSAMRSTRSLPGSIGQHRIAEFGGRPQRPARVHHHRMRRDRFADVDGALELFRREIDHRDAAVGVLVLAEDAAAIDRGINLVPIGRADHFVGGGRHIDFAGLGERAGVEELHLVGALGGEDQRRPARAVVGIGHICRPGSRPAIAQGMSRDDKTKSPADRARIRSAPLGRCGYRRRSIARARSRKPMPTGFPPAASQVAKLYKEQAEPEEECRLPASGTR